MKLQIKFIVSLALLATTCKNLTMSAEGGAAGIGGAAASEQPDLFAVVADPDPERYNELQRLLDSKANPNVKNENGQTPLHRAANCNIVSILLRANANVNAMNQAGDTPLDAANKANRPCRLRKCILIEDGGKTADELANPELHIDRSRMFQPYDEAMCCTCQGGYSVRLLSPAAKSPTAKSHWCRCFGK